MNVLKSYQTLEQEYNMLIVLKCKTRQITIKHNSVFIYVLLPEYCILINYVSFVGVIMALNKQPVIHS